jgi:hypothetical protein
MVIADTFIHGNLDFQIVGTGNTVRVWFRQRGEMVPWEIGHSVEVKHPHDLSETVGFAKDFVTGKIDIEDYHSLVYSR